MKEKPFVKNRARLEILSWIMSFPTIGEKNWGYNCGCDEPIIGDLVALQSAPPSKWYLSWLRDIRIKRHDLEYLLESIDDGSLCWWQNVGLTVYDRKRVKDFPSWQWEDKQFDLNKRWGLTCKRQGCYEVLPKNLHFNKDGSVLFDVRIRWLPEVFSNPVTFPNWKKVTIKHMVAYYQECVEKYNSIKDLT